MPKHHQEKNGEKRKRLSMSTYGDPNRRVAAIHNTRSFMTNDVCHYVATVLFSSFCFGEEDKL
jgi:hypothetical protein